MIVRERLQMDKDAMRQFEVPADMRAMAEKSVEQARVAFNSFLGAAQQAMTNFEGQTLAAQAGAKDIGEKALSYAERNVANTFAFAESGCARQGPAGIYPAADGVRSESDQGAV